MKLDDPLKLPCGAILPNRLVKSSMSENMARPAFHPGIEFFRSYQTWIKGGTGLCISGNVMIDSLHLGEANNIVIEKKIDNIEGLKSWAKAKGETNSHLWIQLNHPGKQSPKFLNSKPLAPSAIELPVPLNNMFHIPKRLEEKEIVDIIKRFGDAARTVKECGFDGVQIHGAHGYLVSQFLSPQHNKRTDKWGGPIENRMKFVKEVYQSIRKAVGVSFPIGIKMNSADFQRGGFSHEEAVFVAKSLSELGIDLIEISGGSYEKPVMTGVPIKDRTTVREAYFLEYASDIKKVITCPLMVTGGFRTGNFIKEALNEGNLDLIGLGRSLCLNPNFSNQLMTGNEVVSEVRPLSSGFKVIDSIFPLEIIWYTMQIHRLGAGKRPNLSASVYQVILQSILQIGLQSIRKVRS